TIHGLADLAALQHSRIALDVRFTAPVVSAVLECALTGAADKQKQTRLIPLQLSPDRATAHVELPARDAGTLRLLAEGDHGIRTEWEAHTLTVLPDQPPSFARVSGSEELKAVLPYVSIPIDIALVDD